MSRPEHLLLSEDGLNSESQYKRGCCYSIALEISFRSTSDLVLLFKKSSLRSVCLTMMFLFCTILLAVPSLILANPISPYLFSQNSGLSSADDSDNASLAGSISDTAEISANVDCNENSFEKVNNDNHGVIKRAESKMCPEAGLGNWFWGPQATNWRAPCNYQILVLKFLHIPMIHPICVYGLNIKCLYLVRI